MDIKKERKNGKKCHWNFENAYFENGWKYCKCLGILKMLKKFENVWKLQNVWKC